MEQLRAKHASASLALEALCTDIGVYQAKVRPAAASHYESLLCAG